jgi:hypothetical protein
MNIEIKPALKIDTFLLEGQRELIGKLVASLECGRTGIAIRCDLDDLLGIQGTLDAIGDAADRADSLDSDEVADLARKVVDGWDLEGCMNSAEQALVDFWTDPSGEADYESCREDYADV